MADKNTEKQISFQIVNDSTSDKTKTKEEFQEFLEDTIMKLELQYDDYVAFVVDNINDTEGANRAILLRLNGGDTQVFFNSSDTFLMSRAVSANEEVTSDNYGLMSPINLAKLLNLDDNLNIEKTNSTVASNNEILSDIIEVDEEKTVNNKNKIYKFKEGKISTIDDINDQLEAHSESIEAISDFLQLENTNSQYLNIQEYIETLVDAKVDKIVSDYINHTHRN